MGPIDIIILVAAVCVFLGVVIGAIVKKKKGKSGCGCGCATCPYGGSCGSKTAPNGEQNASEK